MLNAAVILCGCGRGDGSEIHESVSVLVHLSRLGCRARCFAPDVWQADVVNHATGTAMTGERRNCMIEAARISRGDIAPLAALAAPEFDALFLPGGFGAAKNLCTWAKDGPAATVIPEVERAIQSFHSAGKPIGLCCIAPVIAAVVLGTRHGGPGVTVTIGQDAQTAAGIAAVGADHCVTAVTGSCVDGTRRVVTTPAYMYDRATVFEVFTGIGQMVEQTLALCNAGVPRMN